jgi:DNA repair protein RAD5
MQHCLFQQEPREVLFNNCTELYHESEMDPYWPTLDEEGMMFGDIKYNQSVSAPQLVGGDQAFGDTNVDLCSISLKRNQDERCSFGYLNTSINLNLKKRDVSSLSGIAESLNKRFKTESPVYSPPIPSLSLNNRLFSSPRKEIKMHLNLNFKQTHSSKDEISRLLEKVSDATDTALEEVEPDSTLKCTLRSYQKQALGWMIHREIPIEQSNVKLLPEHWEELVSTMGKKYYYNTQTKQTTWSFPYKDCAEQSPGSTFVQVRGGILADQMGMGKTIEMLSLMVTSKFNPEVDTRTVEGRILSRANLIICPLSVIQQWKNEIVKNSSNLNVYIYHGSNRNRDSEFLSKNDVVITTYSTLAAELPTGTDEITEGLLKIDWFRVILDEAHTIKDKNTRNAKATYLLSAQRRWAVTGTPIQNKLDDLYSLFHFLKVDPFGEVAWWNSVIMKPIRSRDERGFIRLQSVLKQILLRRTKNQLDENNTPIVSLPPRFVKIKKHRFSEQERLFYNNLWNSSKESFNELEQKGLLLNNYAHVLELLLRLRQSCDHPQLVVSSRKPIKCSYCKEESEDILCNPCGLTLCPKCIVCDENNTYQCDVCQNRHLVRDLQPKIDRIQFGNIDWSSIPSTKISALMYELHLIEQADPFEKSIIFSQWTTMLDLVEASLVNSNISFVRLDGTMTQNQRDIAISKFNNDPSVKVFLVSIKAGGVGLNLTAGSRVFLMDPWWNPATEEQAIDRVHRIGQTRPVFVTRFIMEGSVEERILQLQDRKKKLVNGALSINKDKELRALRIEELKLLFNEAPIVYA